MEKYLYEMYLKWTFVFKSNFVGLCLIIIYLINIFSNFLFKNLFSMLNVLKTNLFGW